jgi:hypothetical protein
MVFNSSQVVLSLDILWFAIKLKENQLGRTSYFIRRDAQIKFSKGAMSNFAAAQVSKRWIEEKTRIFFQTLQKINKKLRNFYNTYFTNTWIPKIYKKMATIYSIYCGIICIYINLSFWD